MKPNLDAVQQGLLAGLFGALVVIFGGTQAFPGVPLATSMPPPLPKAGKPPSTLGTSPGSPTSLLPPQTSVPRNPQMETPGTPGTGDGPFPLGTLQTLWPNANLRPAIPGTSSGTSLPPTVEFDQEIIESMDDRNGRTPPGGEGGRPYKDPWGMWDYERIARDIAMAYDLHEVLEGIYENHGKSPAGLLGNEDIVGPTVMEYDRPVAAPSASLELLTRDNSHNLGVTLRTASGASAAPTAPHPGLREGATSDMLPPVDQHVTGAPHPGLREGATSD